MIIPGVCVSAWRDFLMGVHQPADEYKVALYGVNATLSPNTEFYSPNGEVTAPGYVAGGKVLTGYACTTDKGMAVLGWRNPVVWEGATIGAYGALVYNASKGNRAVVVIDFEKKITSTFGDFKLLMPPVTAETALVRIA